MCFHSQMIRLAVSGEVDRLMQIEDDAGRLYGTVGLPDDLPGMPRQMVQQAIADGLLWAVVDDVDVPIAFAMCWLRPGAIHLRELDVHPDHMRRGHGGRLLDHVCRQAAARGLSHVTLTTFSEVPWKRAVLSAQRIRIATRRRVAPMVGRDPESRAAARPR